MTLAKNKITKILTNISKTGNNIWTQKGMEIFVVFFDRQRITKNIPFTMTFCNKHRRLRKIPYIIFFCDKKQKANKIPFKVFGDVTEKDFDYLDIYNECKKQLA